MVGFKAVAHFISALIPFKRYRKKAREKLLNLLYGKNIIYKKGNKIIIVKEDGRKIINPDRIKQLKVVFGGGNRL